MKLFLVLYIAGFGLAHFLGYITQTEPDDIVGWLALAMAASAMADHYAQ